MLDQELWDAFKDAFHRYRIDHAYEWVEGWWPQPADLADVACAVVQSRRAHVLDLTPGRSDHTVTALSE